MTARISLATLVTTECLSEGLSRCHALHDLVLTRPAANQTCRTWSRYVAACLFIYKWSSCRIPQYRFTQPHWLAINLAEKTRWLQTATR